MSNGNGHHWSKFVWRDWTAELALRTCSLGARGFWIEMLCVMHEGTPVGHLSVNGSPATHRMMAAWAGCSEREAKHHEQELESAGVFSRTENGVIYCRRMAREAAADSEQREAWKAYGANGGNPNIVRGTVPKAERQRPYRRSDSPQKTERIFQRDGGRCHWCQAFLVRDNPHHPNFFHVDHVVAVRDGGGVDEHNLVASCQRCNMARAREGYHNGNGHSDNNPPDNPTVTLGTVRQQPSGISPPNPPSQKLELESQIEKESKCLNILTFLVPNPAREEPSAAKVASDGFVTPPDERVDPGYVAAKVATLTRELRHVEYAQGRSGPSPEKQAEALAEPARPKTYHLNRELLDAMPHRKRSLAAAGKA